MGNEIGHSLLPTPEPLLSTSRTSAAYIVMVIFQLLGYHFVEQQAPRALFVRMWCLLLLDVCNILHTRGMLIPLPVLPTDQGVKNLTKSRSEFAELLGRTAQAFGLTPSVGQIYGLLYLSAEPLSLDEIAESLDRSKASASIGTRQLESLHAVQVSSKNADRRDYWEARLEPQEVLQKMMSTVLAPRLANAQPAGVRMQ